MSQKREVKEKIVSVCRKLSSEEKNVLRDVFGLEPGEDVCTVISEDLSKVKEQATATGIISRILSEAVYIDKEGKCRRKGLPILYSPYCWGITETHHCFVCGEAFRPREGELCVECDWLKCPVCGGCACSLSEESVRAIGALFRTFCESCCRFRFR